MHDLDPGASRPSSDSRRCSTRSSPSSSQRASTPRAALRQQAEAVVVGRRAPELQPRAVRRGRCGRPTESSERTPVFGSTTARAAASSTPSAGSAAARGAGAARRDGSASCCQATSWPAGAHSVAARRKKRKVTNRSPRARRQGRARTSSASPGGDAEPRQLAALHRLAVGGELPRARGAGRGSRSRRGCEIRKRLPRDALDAHRLREELELGERGVRGAVGPDDAVGAEVRVVRRLAEVAAVGPVLAAARVASAGCRGRSTPR